MLSPERNGNGGWLLHEDILYPQTPAKSGLHTNKNDKDETMGGDVQVKKDKSLSTWEANFQLSALVENVKK
eukprot:m.346447 g.346447  ORF g.346447 m.346447 type:complete len:71 (+) comp29236_c0_seq1:130-342(+)